MIWDDKGFLLSKFKYSENSVIADFFTTEHGKSSGIIFGASSKRIKGYLQIGNKIHISFSSKSESKLGYFKIEIYKALSPIYFDNHQKLSCIISVMKMVKLYLKKYLICQDQFILELQRLSNRQDFYL